MESARLVFPVPLSAPPGSYIRVFTDNASGTVDFTAPISDRLRIYPRGAVPFRNRTLHNYHARNNGLPGLPGRNQGVHNQQPRNNYTPTVTWTGGKFYGPIDARVYTFAAKIYDETGRVDAASPPEAALVINSAPRPPRNLVASFISGGRLQVVFTPSVELAGINNTPV